MIIEYIVQCIVPMLLALILFSVLLFLKEKQSIMFVCYNGIFFSMGAIVVSLYIAWEKAGRIGEYLYNQFANLIYRRKIMQLGKYRFRNIKQKNLIYIYLESMETTYADENNGGAFTENYIPELTKLAQEK